ncbi:MAG: transferrin-binding protein-like solute binding protein [Cardiobacteriaceae bacterium]|nr:transferrin-binding protein-like solute binding protein [Cardiobacteriaceae bacterium]
MKIQSLMLACSAALLAACGGGGGGSHEMTSDLNTAEIGQGRVITLIPEGFSGAVYRGEDAAYRKVIGNNLQAARYGWVMDKQRGSQHRFFKGNATGEAPTSGSAQYRGIALHQEGFAGPVLEGSAEFVADFAAKRLNGTVSGANFAPVVLQAVIDGDDFAGTLNGVEVHGDFYGHNGAEISGMYGTTDMQQPRSFSGVFGASRQ